MYLKLLLLYGCRCWEAERDDRPSLREVIESLEELVVKEEEAEHSSSS
jgi:hypothetical protein